MKQKVLLNFLSVLIILCVVACSPVNTQDEILEQGYTSLLCVRKDSKFGFVNERGQEVIPCQFDDIGYFSEDWVALRRGRKWAYYDARGRKVLDLGKRFTYCGPFIDGVAFVSTLPTPDVGQLYAKFYENLCEEIKFINRSGEILYEIKGDKNIECTQLIKLGYSDDLLKVVKKKEGERLIGYYDKQGQLVLPFKSRLQSSIRDKFTDGLLVSAVKRSPDSTKSRKIYGYINKSGDWQIPPKYSKALPFKNGVAVVWENHPTRRLHWITYLIDKNGNKVFPDSIRTNETLVRDSLLAVYRPRLDDEGIEVFSSYGKSRRYALARIDGTYITDFIYADLQPGKTSNEPWLASLPEEKLYGFLNEEGILVIPYQYPSINNLFEDGLAVVRVEGGGKATAVIDTSGAIVLPADSSTNYQIGVEILDPIEGNTFKYYNRHGDEINLEGFEKAGTFTRLKLPEE